MRAAVIGCGWAGELHAYAYARNPNTNLVAVCDPDHAKARAVAQRYNCQAFPSLEELLQHHSLDIASIASSTETHTTVGFSLVNKGVPTLCEKPLTRNVADATRLVEVFRAQRVQLGVNYNRRFAAGYRVAKERMAAVGSIRFFSSTLAQNVPLAQTLKLRVKLPKDFLIFDALSHQLDLARYFVGEIVDLFAYGARQSSADLWTDIMVGLRFHNGVIGSLTCSLTGPEWGQLPIERFELGGENERVIVDNITAKVEWFGHKEELHRVWSPNIFSVESYLDSIYNSVDAWIEAVMEGKPAPISPEDGLRVVELCEAVRGAIIQTEQEKFR